MEIVHMFSNKAPVVRHYFSSRTICSNSPGEQRTVLLEFYLPYSFKEMFSLY
jgi:hypothetical protein